jgi:hypothetical protein
MVSTPNDGCRRTVVLAAKAHKRPFQSMLDLPEHPDGFLLGLMRLTKLDCVCCCLEDVVVISVSALRPDEIWKLMYGGPRSYSLPC